MPDTSDSTDPTLMPGSGPNPKETVKRTNPDPRVVPPEVADALPSAHFGKFIRTEKLGAGGMGEVWKAWDTELNRWVALKFLKDDDYEILDRFKREAQLAGRLSHPNIAAVYEFSLDGAKPWIAMQYVPGRTLKSFPRSDRRLLVTLIRDAARALAAAHDQGVIHRDIKPDNLMVVENKSEHRLFVLDFGLARAAEGAGDASTGGFIVGTPSYASPEQARGDTVDARTDVWSLGATLYELLTGRKPFTGTSAMDLLQSVQHDAPTAPHVVDLAIDLDLDTIVLKCLEKAPARRYPTADRLAEDLGRWLAGEPVAARPTGAGERLVRKARRNKALTTAIAAALLATLAGGIIIARQSRTAADAVARTKLTEERIRTLGDLWNRILDAKQDLRQLRVRPPEKARRALENIVAATDAYIAVAPSEPQGHYVKARGLMYLDDLTGAERELTLALTAADFRPGWALLGVLKTERYETESFMTETGEARRRRQKELDALLEGAREAFDRGWQAGREREEAARWGLTWTRDDEVMRRIADFIRVWRQGDKKAAARVLVEGEADFLAEEYALARAMLSDQPSDYDEAIKRAPGWARGYLLRSGRWGEPKRAITDLDRAIELRPDHAPPYLNRAAMKVQVGDIDGGLTDYDRAIQLKPDFPEALSNRALARSGRGDHDGALADLDKAVAIRPGFASGYLNRGLVKFTKGDAKAALIDYDRAIELEPELTEAYRLRGVVRAKSGDIASAAADYERAIQLDPNHAMTYVNRGLAREARGDFPGAVDDYTRAIEKKKDCAEAYSNRGNVKIGRGDARGALADYDQAIALKPDYADAFVNRGVARVQTGNLPGGLADLDRAIELKPASGEAWVNRGLARTQKGDLRGALADFDRGIALLPESAQAYSWRADTRRLAGDLKGALSDYDVAIAKKREYPEALVNRGLVKVDLRDFNGAIADYSRAIDLRPNLVEAHLNRGLAKRHLGDVPGSIKDYDRVIALKPSLPEGWLNRGLAKDAQGDREGARADWRKSLEVAPAAWPGRKRLLELLGE